MIPSINHTLAARAENLTLTGAATMGVDNTLANILDASRLAHGATLSGGGGADTLIGSAWDDVYVVTLLDGPVTIRENAGGGTDTVRLVGPATYYMPDNVENVEITTAGRTEVYGNDLDNHITANEDNDGTYQIDEFWYGYYNGGAGYDTILFSFLDAHSVAIGGSGDDTIESRYGVLFGENIWQGGPGADIYRMPNDPLGNLVIDGFDGAGTAAEDITRKIWVTEDNEDTILSYQAGPDNGEPIAGHVRIIDGATRAADYTADDFFLA
ncbi:MAG: hypothetical protein DI556_20610 [Rhodovulum sulfidophilum]|uniref:Calcium-binding protein n=1 Tax=Rhodovulum sulfidophilum TaxID=35806 RepID=A0A2W5PV07_RHOSU|nr:MAG: hypothetical protein DI556_20610 [Rhodovulum sulfidophilum]